MSRLRVINLAVLCTDNAHEDFIQFLKSIKISKGTREAYIKVMMDIFREREVLRHQLGSHLLLGLEYMIAADIISTIYHPTLIDMALLGSIVVIRTVISHSLQREVDEYDPPDLGKGDSKK